jgi:hypothetical protein
MTEEVKNDEAPKTEVAPLPGTSRADRAAALVATIEHAMVHNAPLPAGTVDVLRDLLYVKKSPADAVMFQPEGA